MIVIGVMNGSIALFISVLVMTQSKLEAAIPLGMPSEEAKVYLTTIAEEVRYFELGEYDNLIAPSYPWQDSDIGYYRVYLGYVKSKWWLPSFGITWNVWVGISENHTVSQVVIRTIMPNTL